MKKRNPNAIVRLGADLEPVENAAGSRNIDVSVVRQKAREAGQRHLAISLAEVAIAGNRLKRKKIACKRLKQRLVEHVADGCGVKVPFAISRAMDMGPKQEKEAAARNVRSCRLEPRLCTMVKLLGWMSLTQSTVASVKRLL